MAEQAYIVVEDLSGEYWEGSLVDPIRANQLRQRGIVVMPVVPDLFRMSGVGGFAKRCWGAGWPLDGLTPRAVTPLTMFCVDTKDMQGLQIQNRIQWRARLTAHPEHLKEFVVDKKGFQGTLRFTPDGSQHNPHRLGLTQTDHPFDIAQLGSPDEKGGWIVGGEAKAVIPLNAHYGFCLYGRAPGLRVVWVAASLY